MTRLLVLIGVALVAAGLSVGLLVPVESDGYDCGSAFRSSDYELEEVDDLLAGGAGDSGCEGELSGALPLPVVLVVLGGVALVGAPFVARREEVTAQS